MILSKLILVCSWSLPDVLVTGEITLIYRHSKFAKKITLTVTAEVCQLQGHISKLPYVDDIIKCDHCNKE